MLTQSEAEALIRMPKAFTKTVTIRMRPGLDETHELVEVDGREQFLLDVSRGRFRLTKYKLQARGRKVIVLARLDIDGAPHTNPDGQRLTGTHLHLYREGYDDKWAYPLDSLEFKNVSDVQQIFQDFCRYTNIRTPLSIQEELL